MTDKEIIARLCRAASGSADVMSEAIQHGIEAGSADWAQMKKCTDELTAALVATIEDVNEGRCPICGRIPWKTLSLPEEQDRLARERWLEAEGA